MSFKAVLEADIKGFSNNIDKAVSDVDRLEKTTLQKLSKVGDSFIKAGAKASVLSTAIVGATVGLVKMGIDAGNASAEINNLSTATSLSTDVIQELAYVATASNSSFGGLQRSMDSFQRRLKTVGEEGSRVNEMFGRLGVSTIDASGNVRSMDDVLLDTFNKLGDMEEGLAKNAIGAELFGRSWNEVALIVSSGSKGIAELRKEANKLGLVLDENTLQSSDDFSTAMGLVGFQLDTLKTKIGASLVPILEETVLPLLQDKVIPAVSQFADFIAQLSEKFNALSPSTKGAILAIGGIATAIGPVLLGLGGLLKILPLIGAGFTAVTGPVGIAIAAVAGAAALIISNWDSIKAYFTTGDGAEMFSIVKEMATELKNGLVDTFNDIKRLVTYVWDAMGSDIVKILKNAFSIIGAVVETLVKTFKNVVQVLDGLFRLDFKTVLDGLKNLFVDIFSGISKIALNAVSSVSSALAGLFELIGLDKWASGLRSFSEKLTPAMQSATESTEETTAAIEDQLAAVDALNNSLGNTAEIAELDTFQKLIGEQLNVRDAITKTVSTIEDLQSKLVKLQLGILPSTNVRQELAETQQQINDLSTALDLLTGDRELNIKVNTGSSIMPLIEPTIDAQGLKDKLKDITYGAMADLSEGIQVITIDLTSMLSSTLTEMFGAVSNAIMNGDSVIDALGASLLGTLGGIMVELGQMVIVTGKAIEAVKVALKGLGGFGAIAAGAALIAIGSLFSAGARKLGNSMGGGGGGYSSAPSLRNTGPGYAPSEYRGAYQDDFKVEFKIGTNELVGVLNTAEQRRNRIG